MPTDMILLIIILILIVAIAVVGIILINKKKKLRLWLNILIPVAFVLVGTASSFLIYLNIYYHATDEVNPYLQSSALVEVCEDSRYYLFDNVENKDKAIVFYGGAKVEEKSYAPMLSKLAEHGVDVYLVKMPFRLALFDLSASDSILSSNPYSAAYLMGHSLGGTSASICLSKTAQHYEGIIFLASYPNQELDDKYKALSIYGSEDAVLNRKQYEERSSYFPEGYQTQIIEGGNHANFAYYGNQSGDNAATITREQQIDLTVSYVADFLEL